MKAMTQRWTQRRTRGALALGIVLAVATPAQASWWCNGMQRVMSKKCCKHKEAPPGDDATLSRTICCEFRAPQAPAPASLRTDLETKTPVVLLAPLTALVLPAPAVLPPSLTARARAHRVGARAGPGRALHDLNAVWLI